MSSLAGLLTKHLIKPLAISTRLYSYKIKPHEWGLHYPIANGKRQSPINLVLDDPGITYKKKYVTNLNVNYSSNDISSVGNNGSSVLFYSENEKAVITGGALGKKIYKLVQFHFHWGSESHCGSEHLLNGRQFSAELHLVHMNTSYSSFEEALTKGDGLCVIGAFIDAQHNCHNKAYQKVVREFEKVNKMGSNKKIDSDIHCRTLLPENLHHYAFYEGSLTTPPLSECVQWICMIDPVVISEEQISEFRKLQGENNEKIVNNYRNIQSLHGRRIAHSCCCCS